MSVLRGSTRKKGWGWGWNKVGEEGAAIAVLIRGCWRCGRGGGRLGYVLMAKEEDGREKNEVGGRGNGEE